MKSPRVVILGLGAIGAALAHRWMQAEVGVTAMTRDGLGRDVTIIDGPRDVSYAIAPASSQQLQQAELLVVSLKAYQVEAAIMQLAPTLPPGLPLLLLHNGLGPQDRACELLPEQPILAGVTSQGALTLATRHVRLTGRGASDIGWLQHGLGGKAEQNLQSLLEHALAPVRWHGDIHRALGQKLAVNAAINPLTAVHQCRNGALLDGAYSDRIQACCKEVATVLNAMGMQLQETALVARVIEVARQTRENYSSMNRDVHHGRTSEIDFINGYIVTQGQRLGIDTPVNRALWQQIRALEGRPMP